MIIMIPIMIYHDISDHFWLVVGPHIKKACRIEHSYSIKSRHVLTFFGWCNLFISLWYTDATLSCRHCAWKRWLGLAVGNAALERCTATKLLQTLRIITCQGFTTAFSTFPHLQESSRMDIQDMNVFQSTSLYFDISYFFCPQSLDSSCEVSLSPAMQRCRPWAPTAAPEVWYRLPLGSILCLNSARPQKLRCLWVSGGGRPGRCSDPRHLS